MLSLKRAGTDRLLGDVIFTCSLILFCIWYGFTAIAVSPEAYNIILVGPACMIGMILGGLIITLRIRRGDVLLETKSESSSELHSILILMFGFSVYVLTIPILRIDFGTFLFLLFGLLLQSRKRIAAALAYAAVVSLFVSYALAALLPVPVPTWLWAAL